MQVVSERFVIDMSIPDTEHHGPYGGAAGCGTVSCSVWTSSWSCLCTMRRSLPRHVYGLSATEALSVWLTKLAYIRDRRGVAVFNIHPVWIDGSNSDMRAAFAEFLDAASAMEDVLVATRSSLASQLTVVEGGGTIGGLPTRTTLPDS